MARLRRLHAYSIDLTGPSPGGRNRNGGGPVLRTAWVPPENPPWSILPPEAQLNANVPQARCDRPQWGWGQADITIEK